MEANVIDRSQEHNNNAVVGTTAKKPASALSPFTRTELAAYAERSGPYYDNDVAAFGPLTADMLSGAACIVAAATPDEKESMFKRVAATMARALKDMWMTEEVMLSRLQWIANQTGLLNLSPGHLIPGAMRSPSIEQTDSVEAGQDGPLPLTRA